MSNTPARKSARLSCESLEGRDVPSSWQTETFDTTALGTLPAGWTQWPTESSSYAVSSARPFAGPKGLATSAASNVATRSWQTTVAPADTAASTTAYLDSLIPTEVVIRGQNLTSATPSYYAATIVRGLTVDLARTVNGVRTVLATISSIDYVSSQWVKLSIVPQGNQLRVEIYNPATAKYLSSARAWQTAQTYAITVTDSSLSADGLVGVARPTSYAGTVNLDNFATLRPDSPTGQNFEATAVGALPSGWMQNSFGDARFAVTATGPAASPIKSLLNNGTTVRKALAWPTTAFGADAEATVAIFLGSAVPAQVIVRGSNLATATPTYYAAQINQGLNLQISRVVNGATSTLVSSGVLRDTSNYWVKLTLQVHANQLKVRLQRTDTNQYLSPNGAWVTQQGWFRQVTDSVITAGQFAGLGRVASGVGAIRLDDFSVTIPDLDTIAPTVAILTPTGTTALSGTIAVMASASDNLAVSRVEFWLDGTLKSTDTASPYSWNFDTTTVAAGAHSLLVKAFDASGNVGMATRDVTVQNGTGNPPPGGPTIPQHYTHIRVAQLAYSGTPFTATETTLLQNSIDLVVPNPQYLSQINAIAPTTPQLIYTNVSNLYEGLLTDWLAYADSKAIDREAAFYHVAQATAFTGGSPSSIPVTYLWGVDKNGVDLTSASRSSTANDVSLGGAIGDRVEFGYPDKYRELNFTINTAAASGWTGVIEYVKATDATGTPTTWGTLPILSNTTGNFTQSGRLTFDPPADWKTSKGTGTTRLYYARIRTLTSGTAPVAASVLGRDYVGANGTTSGISPAFDSAADANGDKYLTDAEYANRAAGKDARFRYESRLFYPFYGQMRFAINPTPQGVKNWAADYHNRLIQTQPHADGFFVDNSTDKSPLQGAVTVESDATYAADTGLLLQTVSNAIAPRWLMANTSSAGPGINHIVSNVAASYEEFALRPMNTTWSRFNDLATLVTARLATPNNPYLILDTSPQNGSPTDSRTMMGALAYYYLLGDPVRTFVNFNGGFEPSTSWSRHWVQAAAYNVGQPLGTWYQFAAGNDPTNSALPYKVFGRQYDNALVLYKPLSYQVGVGTGTIADTTATVHQLGGTYRILQADGTLGATVTSISLRNAEGVVLIKD